MNGALLTGQTSLGNKFDGLVCRLHIFKARPLECGLRVIIGVYCTLRVSNLLDSEATVARRCGLVDAHALPQLRKPYPEMEWLRTLRGRPHLQRWDCLGSLEDWASFPSFFPSFLDSGSARLFCFLEGALAILLTLNNAAEADKYESRMQVWLRRTGFNATLPS